MSFLLGPAEALESGLWSHKPDVPDIPQISLPQTQLDITKGNLAALPGLEDLGTGVNAFQRAERAKTLEGIPGLQALETATLGNLGSWMAGQIPADVQNAIATSGAGRALAGGYGGSGMANNLVARDLGLTSLDLQRMAVPMAQNFIGQEFGMRNVPQFDPTSSFINPMDAAQFYNRQNMEQFNRNWLQARIDAQPEPWQQSIMNSTQELGGMLDEAAASYGGTAMGSMGGGMMGGMKAGAPSMGGNAYWAPSPLSSAPMGSSMDFGGLGATPYNPYSLGGYQY